MGTLGENLFYRQTTMKEEKGQEVSMHIHFLLLVWPVRLDPLHPLGEDSVSKSRKCITSKYFHLLESGVKVPHGNVRAEENVSPKGLPGSKRPASTWPKIALHITTHTRHLPTPNAPRTDAARRPINPKVPHDPNHPLQPAHKNVLWGWPFPTAEDRVKSSFLNTLSTSVQLTIPHLS